MDERPDMPSNAAAGMLATPLSIACETMWKIGPEWAAQHAKCVMPMAHTGHARMMEAPPFAATGCPSGTPIVGMLSARLVARGALRRRHAVGITMIHARSPR